MRPWIVAFFAVVLMALLGAGAWVVSKRQAPPAFTLSNGSVLTFEGATFGTTHDVPGDPRWLRLLPKGLSRILPVAWRGPGSTMSTPAPVLMLWFNRFGPQVSSGDWLCTIVHNDGFEASLNNSTYFGRSTPTNTMEGGPGPVTRRERMLRVRVYEWNRSAGTDRLLGGFTMPNPAPISDARWIAPALPATARDGDFEATLSELSSGRFPTLSAHRDIGRATIRIMEGGVPSTNWQIEMIIGTDATSNQLRMASTRISAEDGAQRLVLSPAPWPSEVYNLSVEFSRLAQGPFAAEELWTLRDLIVPTKGGFSDVNINTNLNGIQVLFRGIATRGSQPTWTWFPIGEQALKFELSPNPKGYRFKLVSITDDQGRKVSEVTVGINGTNCAIGLNLSNDVQRLNVTVAMPKSRFLEFTAQPRHETNAPLR